MANKNYLDKTGLLYFWGRIKDWIAGRHFLSYDSQALTDAEKTQARTNIGAGTYSKPSGGIPASDLATGAIPDVPLASSTAPLMDGTAAVGTGTTWARADHVHPTDTSRASQSDLSSLSTAVSGLTSSAVRYTAQTLTSEQQTQARTNIGAASISDIPTVPVTSVNGKTGAVTLDAADVGATPETFTVTVTQSGDSYSADKTFAEISTAYAEGKRLMAAYPILFSYGGTVVPVTIYSLLVPAIFNSQIIGFASYVDTQQSGIYYHHELNIANGSVDVSTTLKTSDATPSPLGTASAGHSYQFSRDDHVHPMPTASDVGAIALPSNASLGSALIYDGTTWEATTEIVTSVNGSTGAVSLDAYSVGAISSPNGVNAGDVLIYDGAEWIADPLPAADSSTQGIVQLSTDISADGSDNTKAATPQAVVNYVSTQVATVFSFGSSTTFANLPSPSANTVNKIYNISDAFTTTSDFIEGAGKSYPAGTNILGVKIGNDYKYDVTTGFVDLSPYALDAELIAITDAEITAIVV